jgi:hypothetical protein
MPQGGFANSEARESENPSAVQKTSVLYMYFHVLQTQPNTFYFTASKPVELVALTIFLSVNVYTSKGCINFVLRNFLSASFCCIN